MESPELLEAELLVLCVHLGGACPTGLCLSLGVWRRMLLQETS